MADDRMFIACKACNEGVIIAKHFGGAWCENVIPDHFGGFLSEHFACGNDITGDALYRGFELRHENEGDREPVKRWDHDVNGEMKPLSTDPE